MNPLLLNRDFQMPADGFYHVVPLGTFHHASGVDQVIDAAAAEAMVRDYRNRSSKANFPGLLVDFDHFSTDSDKPSEAAGWITDLQNRDAGLYAQIRWSDVGEAAVKGGRYRLVSPVFSATEVVRLENRRIRPLRLLSVALTNDPNLKGMVPLSNRAEPGSPADTQTPTKGHMKSVTEKLGLSAEASEESILEAVTKLMNRATTAEQAVAPLKAENETLKATNAQLQADQVEADLAKYSNRFKPALKEKWRAQLLRNRAQTLELLEGMSDQGGDQPTGTLLNRGDGKTPGGTTTATAANPELAEAAIDEFRLKNRCSYEEARNNVRRAQPALFGLK